MHFYNRSMLFIELNTWNIATFESVTHRGEFKTLEKMLQVSLVMLSLPTGLHPADRILRAS